MQRIQTYNIEVGEYTLPFRFSIMASIEYFELTGQEVSTIKTERAAVDYFYCAYKAGCAYNRENETVSRKDWNNLVDDYPKFMLTLTERFKDNLKKK